MTKTEVSNWGLGIRNPQEPIHPTRRGPLERCIFETDNRTTGTFGRSHCDVNTSLREGDEKDKDAEQHPRMHQQDEDGRIASANGREERVMEGRHMANRVYRRKATDDSWLSSVQDREARV